MQTKGNLYGWDYDIDAPIANATLGLPTTGKTSFGVLGLRADGETPIFNAYSAYTLQVSDDGNKTITDGNSPFDNVAIMYRSRSRTDFIYDTPSLWDGGEHSFYAYYIHGCLYDNDLNLYNNTRRVITEFGVKSITENEATSNKAYLTYKQPESLGEMVDVMTAKTKSMKTDIVPLSFEHRLFAIDVVIRNSQVQGNGLTALSFNGTDAKVTFTVSNGGTLYFDNNTVSASSETCPVVQEFGDFNISAPTNIQDYVEYNLNQHIDSANSFLFLPCESLKVNFSFNFRNSWDEETTYTYDGTIAVQGGFQAGHKYKFILDRKHNSGDMIEFVPQVVETWEENNIHHTFN